MNTDYPMPTENRSSNTEMVSAPTLLAADSDRDMLEYLAEAVETQTYGCDQCGHEEPLSTFDIASDLRDYMLAFPRATAPQPHPEPIAWMVGTAIWWTKEEAERDAADTGLPIVGLGPMTGIATAETCQGEPVGEVVAFGKGLHEIAWAAGRMPRLGAKLYTNADPNVRWETVAGEQMKVIEQLRSELGEAKGEYDRSANKVAALGAHLAERDALLRDKSGDLIRMAANLISAPLFALQDLQDEDKKMTRARVDHAVDVADARLKDAAYEIRRIADALSASAEPSAPAERAHGIPGTSFQRLNALANQGE